MGRQKKLVLFVGLLALVPFILIGGLVYRQDTVRRGVPSPDDAPAPFIGQAPAPPLDGGSIRNIRPSPEETRRRVVAAFPDLVFDKGSRKIPVVALTFDDGPDQYYTPRILDILQQKGVKATFYYTGHHTKTYPAVAQRTVREGHELGNHSATHPHLSTVSSTDIRDQIAQARGIIKEVTGQAPLTLRPPYGEVDLAIAEASRQLGYRAVLWDIDTRDWTSPTKDQILARVLPSIRPGSIILMHSASGGPSENLTGTVQALPEIIDHLAARGLKAVTISEMMHLAGLTAQYPSSAEQQGFDGRIAGRE